MELLPPSLICRQFRQCGGGGDYVTTTTVIPLKRRWTLFRRFAVGTLSSCHCASGQFLRTRFTAASEMIRKQTRRKGNENRWELNINTFTKTKFYYAEKLSWYVPIGHGMQTVELDGRCRPGAHPTNEKKRNQVTIRKHNTRNGLAAFLFRSSVLVNWLTYRTACLQFFSPPSQPCSRLPVWWKLLNTKKRRG